MRESIEWVGPWPDITLLDGEVVTHAVADDGVTQIATTPGGFDYERALMYQFAVFTWANVADPYPATREVQMDVALPPLRFIEVEFKL